MKSYVLITPARNEETYIENTIRSVVAQTALPSTWVIVSDGSTDQTDALVEKYAEKHPYIQLLRNTGDQKRNFGSKVRAFNHGFEYVKDDGFDYIGNLDADITMDSEYYESVLSKFENNSKLGIAGGVRYDLYRGRYRRVNSARNSVGGSIQLFRRNCYEVIGGYRPYQLGGIDAVAETMARMHGWQVECIPELRVYHHRSTGTAGGNIIKGNFRKGMQHYSIGYHPIFHLASCLFHVFHYPGLIGSLAVLIGYFWAMFKNIEIEVPDNFVDYLRAEQLTRLRTFILTGNDQVSNNSNQSIEGFHD